MWGVPEGAFLEWVGYGVCNQLDRRWDLQASLVIWQYHCPFLLFVKELKI